jgi:hypothetical protein
MCPGWGDKEFGEICYLKAIAWESRDDNGSEH